MPRVNSARTRERVDAGATLVLLQPEDAGEQALAGHLVALLFAAAAPLSRAEVTRLLDIPSERLSEVLDELDRRPPLGLAVQRHDEQLQLTTAPTSASLVERFLGSPPPVRLSRAALEALAVVAYRQPVTRGEIDAVRGVNSDSAVATLLARSLVAEVGRRETVGRPALLSLTAECLQYLGIRSLAELPPLPGLERDHQIDGAAAPAPSSTDDTAPTDDAPEENMTLEPE